MYKFIINESVSIMEFVIGIVFSVLFFIFFLQNRVGRPVGDEGTRTGIGQASAEESAQVLSRQPIPRPQSVGQDKSSLMTGMPALVEAPHQMLPQDSVLRRHYMTHARQMIEDLTFAQPTESVLRRHYEQLIESQLDHCLSADMHMQTLTDRYEAFKRAS